MRGEILREGSCDGMRVVERIDAVLWKVVICCRSEGRDDVAAASDGRMREHIGFDPTASSLGEQQRVDRVVMARDCSL